MNVPPAEPITVQAPCPFAYTICTLVNNRAEYDEMRQSFAAAGFGADDCQFLYIDNSQGNQADAYAGLNEFLRAAKGKYVILCHQDILLVHHRRSDLERRMAELDALDPRWGVLGNAGGAEVPVTAGRIQHQDHVWDRRVPLPRRALALDENFILVKNEANLAVSADIRGWHFYGADLCQIAALLGWNAWVIDFYLLHKSLGNLNESFYEVRDALVRKYAAHSRGRFVQTTCIEIPLGGTRWQKWLWAQWGRHLSFQRIYYARKKEREGVRCRETPPPPPLSPGWFGVHWVAHRLLRPVENLIAALRRKK